MNEDRKKIIINEIVYWRENKLLPESYCNFLLTLYTEGDGVQTPNKSLTPTKGFTFVIIIIGLLLPVLFLVTYFTEISPHLQMVLNFIFLIICIFLLVVNRKNRLILHIGSVILALMLLVLSVNICEIIFKGQTLYLLIIIFLNCLGWFLVGTFTKKRYFLFAGLIGMVVSVILFI